MVTPDTILRWFPQWHHTGCWIHSQEVSGRIIAFVVSRPRHVGLLRFDAIARMLQSTMETICCASVDDMTWPEKVVQALGGKKELSGRLAEKR